MWRRLTIDYGDRLRPQDHVAWFGDGVDDLYATASTTLSVAAHGNEKLLFIADAPDPERLSGFDDLDRLLDSGQLELASPRLRPPSVRFTSAAATT